MENTKNFKKRFTPEEIVERKKSLAAERNTRVMWADIPDTHRICDMVAALNRGVKQLRHQLGYRVSFDEGVKHLQNLKDLELKMDAITREICDSVGVKYRSPVSIQKLNLTVGDVEGSIAEKALDSKMEMAYAGDDDNGMFAKKKS